MANNQTPGAVCNGMWLRSAQQCILHMRGVRLGSSQEVLDGAHCAGAVEGPIGHTILLHQQWAGVCCKVRMGDAVLLRQWSRVQLRHIIHVPRISGICPIGTSPSLSNALGSSSVVSLAANRPTHTLSTTGSTAPPSYSG